MVKGFEDLFGTLFGIGQQVGAVNGMVMTNCPACGTPFAIEASLWANLHQNGNKFYCPNGHPQWFGETEADKLRKQLAQEAKKREQLETQVKRAEGQAKLADRRRAAAKGQTTKLRNEIANGRCPCCGKVFVHLQSHMAAEHPDFETTEPEEAAS